MLRLSTLPSSDHRRLLMPSHWYCHTNAQIYFITLLYSYAAHLRGSTYHALPLTSRAKATKLVHPTTQADRHAEEVHDELEIGASEGDVGKGNEFVGKNGDAAGGAEAGPSGSGASGEAEGSRKSKPGEDRSWE